MGDMDFGAGHPMAPVRLGLTIGLSRELGLLDHPDVEVVGAAPAGDDLLATVHTREYIAAVRAASADGTVDGAYGLGTSDVPVFPGMHEAAARVVAASTDAVLAIWFGEVDHAVNISGGLHHAMPDRASGFCVYNDPAVAIRCLIDAGAERVAYIDLDAHHGDGVERVFWDDPRVLTVSVHQSPDTLFPGTGRAQDTGGPQARGTKVNLALPAGTADAAWLRGVYAVVDPAVRAFGPEFVISQHGCDVHAADPQADLAVSVGAQRAAMDLVHSLAHEVAAGKWLALGGGGYAIVDVVPRAWSQLISVVTHRPIPPGTPVPEGWRDLLREHFGRPGPALMSDGATPVFRPWSDGFDRSDRVDAAVIATRTATFPALGILSILE